MSNPIPMNSRAEVLALLNGQRPARIPCFSGLINVTEAGLAQAGLRFSEAHHDANKMAAAALTSHQLFGWESVVAPLDLCVEAEALGAVVDFHDDAPELMFPIIAAPLFPTLAEFNLSIPADVLRRGRLLVVQDALRILKAQVGGATVVGACVPGPFTLAVQVIALNEVLAHVAQLPEFVDYVLEVLTPFLSRVAQAYVLAGADFVTVHEMGGSPGVIGPRAFETLVLPHLQHLIGDVRAAAVPCVLSVCGRTNHAMPLLAASGANAISVDQLNNLAQSRATLGPQVLLFGNIDPVGVLVNGAESDVRRVVSQAIAAGADAIWPGCDLWPSVPAANMRAMVEAARQA